jgi:hypothetical protein
MNLDTLESRLTNFLRQEAMHNHNKQNPQLVSSSPMGTMTPTPDMSHGSNSSMAVASSIDASRISSSGCNRIVSTSFNGVNMLPAGGMLGSSKDHKDVSILFIFCFCISFEVCYLNNHFFGQIMVVVLYIYNFSIFYTIE